MPKGFNGREKDLITEKLFSEGTRLFNLYGIRKTTVEEIAKSAGISKGSFYSFYASKEELFFAILESLDRENKARFSGEVFVPGRPNRESFRLFLLEIFDAIRNNSIMNHMDPAELEQLRRKLPEGMLASHLENDNSYFEEFYLKWKDRGVFREIDPKAFTGIIKLAFYLSLHREEYTGEEYMATRDLFISMQENYLVIEPRS